MTCVVTGRVRIPNVQASYAPRRATRRYPQMAGGAVAAVFIIDRRGRDSLGFGTNDVEAVPPKPGGTPPLASLHASAVPAAGARWCGEQAQSAAPNLRIRRHPGSGRLASPANSSTASPAPVVRPHSADSGSVRAGRPLLEAALTSPVTSRICCDRHSPRRDSRHILRGRSLPVPGPI